MAKDEPTMKQADANPDNLEAVPPLATGDPATPGQVNTQPQAVSDQRRAEVYQDQLPSPVRTSDPRAVIRNPLDPEDETFSKLLKLTGFKKNEITGYSSASRTIVTSTGGKYTLKKSGRTVRTISGPPSPAEQQQDQEEED